MHKTKVRLVELKTERGQSMSNEVKLNDETSVINPLTETEKKRLTSLITLINNNLKKTEGAAQSTAFALYEIDKKKLYRGDGYTGIGPYAKDMFGISKATTSSAISVVDRFSDDTNMRIREEFNEYKFSTLMVIKSLSDAEIKANIPSDTSRDKAKEIVQKLNGKTEEEKLAIATRKEIDGIYREAVLQGTDKALLKEQVEERVGFKVTKDCTQDQLDTLKKELSDITGITSDKEQKTIYLTDYVLDTDVLDLGSLLRDLSEFGKHKNGAIVKLMPEKVEASKYNAIKEAVERLTK